MTLRVRATERQKTARLRFYCYTGKLHETYPYVICDAEKEPKAIARFKNSCDAGLFLEARRDQYIKTGE